MRILVLVVGVVAFLAIPVAMLFTFERAFSCGLEDCGTGTSVALTMMPFAPLLLLISFIAGVVAFRCPTPVLIALTLVPAGLEAIAAATLVLAS